MRNLPDGVEEILLRPVGTGRMARYGIFWY